MYTITIEVDTWLKATQTQSSLITNPNDKIFLKKGETLEVEFALEQGNHLYVGFPQNRHRNGRYNWFLFIPHISIVDNDDKPSSKRVQLKVPFLSQRDNKVRPNQTCNVTCCSMVIEFFYPGTSMKYDQQLEDVLTEFITKKYGADGIYYHDILVKALSEWGVKSIFNTKTSFNDMRTSLDNGNPVIYSGKFTGSGHIIVITGYDPVKKVWIVNDPWGEFFYSGYKPTSGKGLEYSYNLLSNVSYSGDHHGWGHLCSKLN